MKLCCIILIVLLLVCNILTINIKKELLKEKIKILNPEITINNEAWIVLTQQMSSISLSILGEDLRSDLRHGRGVWYYHELPVRHQLARLYGKGG